MNADRGLCTAHNRFGLGARAGDPGRGVDPRALLEQQLHGDGGLAAFASLPPSTVYLHEEARVLAQARQARRAGAQADAASPRAALRDRLRRELEIRYAHAIATPDGFAERLVRFWSNHFAVSIDKRVALPYAAPMEREAIRPHVFGRFADLLLAVERHPAMLRYLDNVRSVGDDSALAQRAAGRRTLGLNENLAREILELHTLGVDGGYTQADVAELARAITGWSTPVPREALAAPPDAAFRFRAAAHAPGARTVLGRRYAEAGPAQGEAVLRDLAVHPATARHVAFRLARHFVADDPPTALVDRLATAWRRSGGDLPTVYRALIDAPEAWSPDARKFKTPDDYLVSALRAVDLQLPAQRLQAMLAQLGQPPFMPRSPAGFPDVAAAWNGGDALFKRIQAAQRLSALAPVLHGGPLEVARRALGTGLDPGTATAIGRAESARAGLALLLASPAFQWRT